MAGPQHTHAPLGKLDAAGSCKGGMTVSHLGLEGCMGLEQQVEGGGLAHDAFAHPSAVAPMPQVRLYNCQKKKSFWVYS